jgi:hypothetical protein
VNWNCRFPIKSKTRKVSKIGNLKVKGTTENTFCSEEGEYLPFYQMLFRRTTLV